MLASRSAAEAVPNTRNANATVRLAHIARDAPHLYLCLPKLIMPLLLPSKRRRSESRAQRHINTHTNIIEYIQWSLATTSARFEIGRSGVSRGWFSRPEVEAQGWSLGRGCRQSSNFPPRLVDCENATKEPIKWLRMIRNHAWNSSISPPPICWRKPCPAIRRAKRSVLAYLGSRKRDC